ncbi:putative membrane protein [Anoxybacillus calidus]|uniref:Putative membrane protein n=1 Tax=[Anoxybacillus] calidus TaxID=575178 RepID=A0A7V9YZN9_9BACL|nr:putative membrane protein [Anoxybacillus calidus]
MIPLFEHLLVGLLFLGSGFLLFWFPPKKINGIYGYRTPKSMENEKNWVVANRYSSQLFIVFGLLLLIIGGVSQNALITLTFTVIFTILLFLLVEKKLRSL